jgi:hypothetical protein
MQDDGMKKNIGLNIGLRPHFSKLAPLVPWLGGAALLWLTGVMWSTSWVDKLSAGDFPGRYQLTAARLFWSMSPAIDRDADANRAFKLSWLKASTDINRKEKKEIIKIVAVLTSEFSFVGDYLKLHSKSMSKEMQTKAATQLLTYLNRVELYQNYSNEALESKIREFGSGIHIATPATQENWYREVMIRSHMKGDYDLFQENRRQLMKLLNEHGQDLPVDFIDGVLFFYDGVLLCIEKKPDAADSPLASAAKKLASNPQLTTNFLQQDLNVLLLGKGMESGAGCNQSLTNVIFSGG